MTEARPRILVTTSTFPRWMNDTEPGFVYDLCRSLSQQGMDVDVLAPHAHGARDFELMHDIRVFRYRYFCSRFQSLAYSGGILANLKKNPLNLIQVPFFLLFQLFALYRLLGSGNYSLVHAHWVIPQAIVCAMVNLLRPNNPVALVCTSHGGDLYGLDNPLFRQIKKWTIRRCNYFCVVSSAMQRKAIELGAPADKIRVMPMGVDLEHRFRPVDDIGRRDNRIIFVGRLVEKKGVSYLLEAMVGVIKAFPDVELIIVGDGPFRPSLEQQTIRAGLQEHVKFHGKVMNEQLPALYSSASIAVVPSIIAASGDQEGLGLVIIEALGCECAVIASSLEPIKDVLDENTGCLVRPANVADLTEKISLLLGDRDLRTRLARQGRQKVLNRFEQQITSANYVRLLQEVARAQH
jgi:glycosyltransferase involved in cell wall biosynthesis